MSVQDDQRDAMNPVFLFPRNWTAIFFFGLLGLVHWSMALAARRSGAHMSFIFGTIFIAVSISCFLIRRRLVLLSRRRYMVADAVLGSFRLRRRFISFDEVMNVRVSLLGTAGGESGLRIICRDEEIELPPMSMPRQVALLLAMTFGVPLVKIYGPGQLPEPARRIARLFRNEDAI